MGVTEIHVFGGRIVNERCCAARGPKDLSVRLPVVHFRSLALAT